MSHMPATVCLQKHFTKNRALANGLSLVGISCGNITAPYLAEILIDWCGWRGTLLLHAGILANKIPLALTLRTPRKPKGDSINTDVQPEKRAEVVTCWVLLKKSMDFTLFKSKIFSLFCVGSIMQRIFVMSFVHHLPSFIVYQGFTMDQAAFLASAVFISNISSRLVFTFISNFRCINFLVQYTVGTLIGSVAVVILLAVGGYEGIFSSVILVGLHLGNILQTKTC